MKVRGGAGSVLGVVDVASTPAEIAHTRIGDVSYRILEKGPALLLIMGYAGTMETWDPRFVNALAEHFRVVVFDNSGVGRTTALRSPLTIDEMANQTSALITSLRLTKTDVLGWSMGGMIAQARAVLQPSQVNRLVLCATFPGTGKVVKSKQRLIDALTDSSLPRAKTVLFPANQAVAQDAFLLAHTRYPTHASVSTVTIKAQGSAVKKWRNDKDTAGRKISVIHARTLVADGFSDTLDAVVNDRALARRVRGAQISLYADAGHAFLFQKWSTVVLRVRAFQR